jgi:tRNA threonylcarbamoyladenosine biosynthesis protein TsaB
LASLLIDTTHFLLINLLDKDQETLSDYFEVNKKNSTVLHAEVYSMLDKCSLTIKDVDTIVTIAGPGSYTGMRLSEGFSQVFDWHGVNVVSAYHFDIPKLVSDEKYIWISNAFKGEDFIYISDENKNYRVISNKISEVVHDFISKGYKVYTHYKKNKLGEDIYPFNIEESSLLLKNNPVVLKKIIGKKEKKEIYYYRSIEEEFTPSLK